MEERNGYIDYEEVINEGNDLAKIDVHIKITKID